MLSSYFPVFAGRVSDQVVRGRASYQLQSDQASLQTLQNQLSTGVRFQNASEDPTAAIKVLSLQRTQRLKEQQIVNLKSAEGYLNTTESALSSSQDILNSLKSIAIDGVSNLLSENDRQGLLSQIDGYLSSLTNIANQHSQDRFLFSGGDVEQLPIKLQNKTVRFNGNDTELLTIADSNDYLAHNVTGQSALGLISDAITGTVDLNPALSPTTRLTDLGNGRGVVPTAIQFSDGVDQIIVDLSSAKNLGEIVDKLNAVSVSGRTITASIGTNGLQVNYTDGFPGTLRITNVGSGKSASELGIATTDAQPFLPITGQDLDPILRTTTPLSALNGGLGISSGDGLTIKQGSNIYPIDFTGATTVEDLLSRINNSGAGILADIAPGTQSIRVRSTESGSDFSISERNGTLAEQLGIRTFNGSTRLADLNHSQGIQLSESADLSFTRSDGTQFNVDLQSAVTVQDVINLINNSPDNTDPNLKITASLNPTDNGLVLKAAVPVLPIPLPDPLPTVVPISVRSINGSAAASLLGLAPLDATAATSSIVSGEYVLNGGDPNRREVKGTFNSILRLRQAIQDGNAAEVGRASALIDEDIDRISFARGTLGIRLQRIDSLKALAEDNIIQLKSQESDNRDIDYASVVTELSARQAAYEANLKLLAQANQASIFSYI